MSLKLSSFQYQSTTPTGWNSTDIQFGKEFTILLGENGTGKSAMMWGMAYALGYPLELAPDIKNNVTATKLSMRQNSNDLSLIRHISNDFQIDLSKNSKPEKTFTSEGDFSNYFFDLLGIETTNLSPSKGEKAVKPFISTFLPLIWVSQSKGWTFLYQPLANRKFILNQREEMIRLLLNIPPKNPFDRKKTYEEKKKELEVLTQRLELAKEYIKDYKKEIGAVANLKLNEVDDQKALVRKLIVDSRIQLASTQQSTAQIDNSIQSQKVHINHILFEVRDLESKRESLETAYKEIDGDSEVLESNELATDEFRSICGTEHCKIFDASRNLYGKRLLYLRDQLKDIQSTSNSLLQKIQSAKEIEKTENKKLESLEDSRKQLLANQGVDGLLKVIEDASGKFLLLDEQSRQLQMLNKLNINLGELLNRRTALEEVVSDLRPRGGKVDKTRLFDVLAFFKDSFARWLNILNTPNIKEANLDESFNVFINGEKFTEDSFQDGSTRARIVLAYFASLFETSVVQGQKHPGFMFLDTPRQHELHLPDLKNYFSELRNLLQKHKCQIVIACKDQIFEPTDADKTFGPAYKFGEELRYLGPKGLEVT